ncbi:hypothetical protein ACFLSY_10355, partial [Bacteroidota bacterium]
FSKLYRYSDSLSMWENNTDIIYRIVDNKTIIPRYKINITSNKIPFEVLKSKDFMQNLDYYYYYNVFEVEKYFFFNGLNERLRRQIVYDKQKKNSYYLENGFINDIDGGLPFWPRDITNNGNLISYIDIIEIKRHLQKQTVSQNKVKTLCDNSNLLEILKRSKIDDNPILVIVRLK